MNDRQRQFEHQPGRAPGSILMAVLLLLAAGCAHGPGGDQEARSSEPVGQPAGTQFLLGPMSLLFTNVDGFTAHVVVERAGAGARGRPPMTGDLFGRSGQLAFVPEGAGGSARRASGALTLLWDVTANSGFLVSEALQGYAPVTTTVTYTNLATQAGAATSGARIDGQPCALTDVMVAANDGTFSAFRVWRATELGGLPLQIVASRENDTTTVRLSKVRQGPPAPDLFVVPPGFTKYDSLDVMVAELRLRQRSLWRGGDRPLVPADTLGDPGRPPRTTP